LTLLETRTQMAAPRPEHAHTTDEFHQQEDLTGTYWTMGFAGSSKSSLFKDDFLPTPEVGDEKVHVQVLAPFECLRATVVVDLQRPWILPT